MRRRLKSNQSGVSEVMGTMLILLITVVIFSSILIWVSALPAPVAARSVTFEGGLSGNYVGGIWQGASVNLVHLGGEDLSEGGTRVYLTIDNTTEVLKTRGTFFDGVSVKTYGVEDADGIWRIGGDWRYLNESIPQEATVSVLVVDLVRGVVLWDETLFGAPGNRAPIFLDKWVDPLPSTLTRDRVEPNDKFTVYAKVIDPDADLNNRSVWAYLTFGLNATPLGYVQLLDDGSSSAGDALAGDSIFSRALSYKAQKAWDGGIILLNATDTEGHTSATRLILKVGRGSGAVGNPFNGTWNSTLGGIGQGDSGPQGDQGWNIYDEEGLPDADDPGGTPTRTFLPGDTVYVIVRSTVIQNTENINSFVLRDSAGAKLYPPTEEFDTRDPTKTDPAFTQTVTSPYFEYEYSFAAPATEGAYSVELTIKDNGGHVFIFGTDVIYVTTSGAPPAYPKLLTYRDPNQDGDLSDLVESITFNSTESLYVRIFFQDLDNDLVSCAPWFPDTTCPVDVNANVGDAELMDYYGGLQVKKRPGFAPVSNVSTYAFDLPGEFSYIYYIDLLRRDQDLWLAGSNYYTLRMRVITDFGYGSTTAESYQLLAQQVKVVAPGSTLDIVGTTHSGGGKEGRGIYWYERSYTYQEHIIDDYPKSVKKPLAMATGDLNGDTRIDVVVALDAKELTNIVAYINLDNGRTWRREFITPFETDKDNLVESLVIADLDGDGDGDVVGGTRKGATGVGVVVFWNDGVWSSQLLTYSQPGPVPHVRSVAVGDVNNDGRPDIASGDGGGNVTYYCNNVRGSFLAGASTPCPPSTDTAPPMDSTAFMQGVWVGDGDAIQFNSLRLARMEGSAASDTTLDIVTSHKKEMIIYRTAVSGGVPTFTRYDLGFTGDPFNAYIVLSLDVGDMNGDGLIDIVVGSDSGAAKKTVYRLRNMGMTPGPSPTFNDWASIEIPHTTPQVADPSKLSDIGKVLDVALGDVDGDGDLDIVFVSEKEQTGLNNFWFVENVGDIQSTYRESNVTTDSFNKKGEKAFAVELAYMDL